MAEQAAPNPVVSLSFSAGLDNRSRETDMPDGAWRVLDNVDATREGNILVRQGLRQLLTGAWHSLIQYQGRLYAVKDGVLGYYVGGVFTALVTLSPDAPVRYAIHNEELYWTTPYQQGRIVGATATIWGMALPPLTQATTSSVGGLDAGIYQVTMTAVHSSGLESGASDPVAVTVAQNGGINITVPTGSSFRVYRSAANGGRDELRLAATLGSGESATLGKADLGKRLESLFAAKPPPGQALCSFKGRLWVAAGSVLQYTSHLSPHWILPHSYFSFPEPIAGLDAAEDGLYVATSGGVWFLGGTDPAQMTQRLVSTVGAVPGSPAHDLPLDVFTGEGQLAAKQAVWLDNDGYLCLGKPGGMLVHPHKQRYSMGQHSRASLAFRQYQGQRQVLVMASSDEETNPLIAVDGTVSGVAANGFALNS